MLVQASLFNVPRGLSHNYDIQQLERILGCLIKVTRLNRKPPSVFKRDNDDAAAGDDDDLVSACREDHHDDHFESSCQYDELHSRSVHHHIAVFVLVAGAGQEHHDDDFRPLFAR